MSDQGGYRAARAAKNTNELTVRGGGGVNPYGQPDRKISVFITITIIITNIVSETVRLSNITLIQILHFSIAMPLLSICFHINL